MWFKIEDSAITETYVSPKALIIGDTQYPQNIFSMWTEAELNAIGIYTLDSIDTTNQKSSGYYTNTGVTYTFAGGKVTGSYGVAGAKNLDDSTDMEGTLVKGLKTQHKEEVDRIQYSLLLDSDWMVIRKGDTDEALPTDWKTYRDAVRTKSNNLKTAIDAAANVDALAAIEYDWPSKPS